MQRFLQKHLPRLLLAILNSRYINDSPCEYGWINGLDAISYNELKNEIKINPDATVQDVIDAIDRFNTCPIYNNRTIVLLDNGESRDATIWDVQELRNALSKK